MKYDLETLAHIENFYMFRDDMREFMIDRDYPSDIIMVYTTSDAVKEHNFLKLYQVSGRNLEYAKWFHKWIRDCILASQESNEKHFKYLLGEKRKVAVKDELSQTDIQRLKELNDAIKTCRTMRKKFVEWLED